MAPSPPGEGRGGKRGLPQGSSNLKILDPACGSGSFLLGAYQYLLDWHPTGMPRTTRRPGPRAKPRPSTQAGKGEWRLTTAEKKRILLDNIFGVDIDLQAVEVTKLSLLLKVLEGASGQMALGLERVLPDLDNNIKCGNSLIGPDYYEGQMFPDEEERYRVNAFNWKAAFPQIFIAGGFDVVIGNPPYVRARTIKRIQELFPKTLQCILMALLIYMLILLNSHYGLPKWRKILFYCLK